MILTLDKLSFTYAGASRPALHNLSFTASAGEVLGILGRCGAGKSTLSLLLNGFMPGFFQGEASGQAQIAGLDLLALSPADLARTVALVLSDPFGQISGTRFSVFEEVATALENLGYPPDEIRERCTWALETLGINELRDRSPYALSGGQQQRLVLAAALALRPQVLVLDQPAAQLDPHTVRELGETLRGLAAAGTTVVVAEARADWLARIADRVLLLHNGEACVLGPTDEVLCNPLLAEIGIRSPQPALLAAELRKRGAGFIDTPLPLRSEELLAMHPPAMAEPTPPQLLPVPASEPPLVAVERVSFRYPNGVAALNAVNFTIQPRERIALLGRNGTGKSTLLRHLNGLLHPSEGRVLLKGEDTRQKTVAQCAHTTALSFQDVRNQLFAATVRKELVFGPQNLGYPPERRDALVAQALKATGLVAHADDHPYDLLPQQRRLVAIGAALAMDTPLLVLDEPGAGMDDEGLRLLEAIIAGRTDAGCSVLVVSHDVEFSFATTERVLLLVHGKLVVDNAWQRLSSEERALLDAEVGLPLALMRV